jgi:DNA-binding NarL/FixJ family response regulator
VVNVMIVEDQRTARKVLEEAIERSTNYRLVQSIANAGMAELYCMRGEVDLILMDVYTSQRENGLEAAKKIKRNYPKIKIIIVTSMPEHSFIEKAKQAGCESFWYKEVGEDNLLDVMDKTMMGESVYPDATPVLNIGEARSVDFTPRELDVLREKVNGYSNQEVCQRLEIKKSTLDYHINNILSKTGYTSVMRLSIDIVDQKFIIPDF